MGGILGGSGWGKGLLNFHTVSDKNLRCGKAGYHWWLCILSMHVESYSVLQTGLHFEQLCNSQKL